MLGATEEKSKLERINVLKEHMFNIPRFYHVKTSIFLKKIDESIPGCIYWARKIHEKSPKQKFNIRTYEFSRKTSEEKKAGEHVTDLKFENLEGELRRLLKTKDCMVDAETPDDGMIAGNVIIHQNETAKAIKTFTMEFCIKPVRAMVREHDKSVSGTLEDGGNILHELYEKHLSKEISVKQVSEFFYDVNPSFVVPSILYVILAEANKFPIKNVILEWTVFNKPAGILFDDKNYSTLSRMTVWWEWRRS